MEVYVGPLHMPDLPWPLEKQCRQLKRRSDNNRTFVAGDCSHQTFYFQRFGNGSSVLFHGRL